MVTIKNVKLMGGTVGIKMTGSGHLNAENVSFEGVETPFDIGPEATANISGTRITGDPKVGPDARARSSVGWSRPNGPPLPAFCPQCKEIFPSKNYNLGSPLFLSHDNEEVCPNCGSEHAKLAEGLFNLSSEVVEILSGPDITHAMLAAIQSTAKRAASGAISPHEAVRELRTVSPILASRARKAFRGGSTTTSWLMVFLTLVTTILLYQNNENAKDSNAINRDANRIAQETLDLSRQQALSAEEVLAKALEALAEQQRKDKSEKIQDKIEGGENDTGTDPSDLKSSRESGPLELQSKNIPDVE